MRPSIPTALLLALAATACLRADPVPAFTPAWEPFDAAAAGWERTREALLVSDCQLHNLYSYPLPDRNLSAESAVHTAIRPPQLDLFSADTLAWILRNGAPEADVVLHLGDALDLACEGEFARFAEVMEAAGRPWFMAPGNHDSYYFGVYDPEHVTLWDDACHGAGRRLSKDVFLRLYLATLLRQRGAGTDALVDSLGLTAVRDAPRAALGDMLPPVFEWHAPPGTPGFLDAIAWSIDVERPWRSFLLQAIDMTREGSEELRVRALLLDSCQYQRRPVMVPNGWRSYPVALNCGNAGQMLPDQLRLIRAWLEEDTSRFHAFMCHHPFDALAPESRSSLGWLWESFEVTTLVTAHTHLGYYAHHDLGGAQDRLELNIASTTDWPMEWRAFSGYRNLEGTAAYLRAERFTLVDELSHREGFFLPGWEVPLGAPDDYRKYKQGESDRQMFIDYTIAFHLTPHWLPQPPVWAGAGARSTAEAVKDTLLWTHLRLLREFPTAAATVRPEKGPVEWPAGCASDEEVGARIEATLAADEAFAAKVALLMELGPFERTRPSADPATGASTDDVRRRYKISQAAWASRFEHAEGRRLSVEDELIRIERLRGSRPPNE